MTWFVSCPPTIQECKKCCFSDKTLLKVDIGLERKGDRSLNQYRFLCFKTLVLSIPPSIIHEHVECDQNVVVKIYFYFYRIREHAWMEAENIQQKVETEGEVFLNSL